GTINTFRMTLGGRSQEFRTRFAEPVPGRVLTETDEKKQIRTSFTVTPEGPICRVRIDTEWEPSGGIQGRIERLMAPRMLRGLYRAELEKLKDYARSQGG
ncbi:MAG TPA: SRPBCC family protein, partial [Chloroflexota bacterium]|nr:SRPBCC family protein [Chloroflexota bacterium]